MSWPAGRQGSVPAGHRDGEGRRNGSSRDSPGTWIHRDGGRGTGTSVLAGLPQPLKSGRGRFLGRILSPRQAWSSGIPAGPSFRGPSHPETFLVPNVPPVPRVGISTLCPKGMSPSMGTEQGALRPPRAGDRALGAASGAPCLSQGVSVHSKTIGKREKGEKHPTHHRRRRACWSRG